MVLLLLKIIGGIIALALGLYLGLGGRYEPDFEEIEKSLGPGGRPRKVKRHFTLFGWLRQSDERPSRTRRRQRGASNRRFNLVLPDSKPDSRKDPSDRSRGRFKLVLPDSKKDSDASSREGS